MTEKKLKENVEPCLLLDILKILGGKWSMSIIYVLFPGPMRFSEIERSIPNINTRMLVKELKNLANNGIVSREVFATVPATVEYSLTPKGKKLEPIINEIFKWGKEFVA